MTDGREIAHQDEGGRAVAHQSDSSNVLAMILEAARDPDVDAAKVETMANLAIKLQDRERETQFAQDLNAAIMEMPYISKRGAILNKNGGVQSRYSTYEDIDRVVRPILARHNLTIRFEVGGSNGRVTARPILTHNNGYIDRGEAIEMPMDDSGSKNRTQGVGSAASYAKRHAYKAACNIVEHGEDDDGQLGIVPTDPQTDKQFRVLEAAEAVARDGPQAYQDWFEKQEPRDKAWLIQTGRHAEFGGATVALPAIDAKPKEKPKPKPPADDPPPQEEKPAQQKATQTAEQWAKAVQARIATISDQDKLDEYIDGKRDALARLHDTDLDLYQSIMDAINKRRDAIRAGGFV